MDKLSRFGISVKKDLLEDFDKLINLLNYPTRSKAIEDLIRAEMVRKKWVGSDYIAGAILIVYDHHKRELIKSIIEIQHDSHDIIVSSQHIHLNKDTCLEIIVIKGRPGKAEELFYSLKATKGIKNATLNIATIENRHRSTRAQE